MRSNWIPDSVESYSNYLYNLRERRRAKKKLEKMHRTSRTALSKQQRQNILKKTDSRCHICGGHISSQWQADHVLAHSKGGGNVEDNYLPAHASCNNYRWDYDPGEIQEVLRLGIWLRTQIIRQSRIGKEAAERFLKYEENRVGRTKSEG